MGRDGSLPMRGRQCRARRQFAACHPAMPRSQPEVFRRNEAVTAINVYRGVVIESTSPAPPSPPPGGRPPRVAFGPQRTPDRFDYAVLAMPTHCVVAHRLQCELTDSCESRPSRARDQVPGEVLAAVLDSTGHPAKARITVHEAGRPTGSTPASAPCGKGPTTRWAHPIWISRYSPEVPMPSGSSATSSKSSTRECGHCSVIGGTTWWMALTS